MVLILPTPLAPEVYATVEITPSRERKTAPFNINGLGAAYVAVSVPFLGERNDKGVAKRYSLAVRGYCTFGITLWAPLSGGAQNCARGGEMPSQWRGGYHS
jgi:hypothetical protein